MSKGLVGIRQSFHPDEINVLSHPQNLIDPQQIFPGCVSKNSITKHFCHGLAKNCTRQQFNFGLFSYFQDLGKSMHATDMKPETSLVSNFENTFPMTECQSLAFLKKFWQDCYHGNNITLEIFIFYCVNTSYPMDNCFTGRRDWSHQTPEKDILYRIPAGPVRRVHSPGGASYFLFLSRHRDVIASFSFGACRVKMCFQRQGNFGFIPNSSVLFHI